MGLVVLVNGLPAAGKSTLARALARQLALPLFSKDVINETHASVLGSAAPGRSWNRALGAAASETMWALLADAPCGAVLENSWRADVRPLVAKGLARAGIERARALMTADEWAAMVANGEPLGLGPVIRIDTSRPVDIPALAARVVPLSNLPAPQGENKT